MDNPETLATLGTLDTGRKQTHTTQDENTHITQDENTHTHTHTHNTDN